MAWRSLAESNEEMIKNFKQISIITSKVVENAFLAVPRAAFLPEYLHDEAYADCPVRGDDHLHMSAPHMYATVLEALEVKEGMSFLNLGSGTGYFSMLAGYIVGVHGVNHGVELRANLVEHANECCDEFFMYYPKMRKKICYPQFIAGNCFHIDPSAHKYDRVYCGAACPREKFDFLLQLVKPGGLIVVPSENKLLKLNRLVPSGVKETALSDVCFESLVLPTEDEQFAKLRFAAVKTKIRKVKVYPAPDLFVPKTSARKSLARLRALQDVVESFRETGCIPKSFAYVPSFAQISQLTETPGCLNEDYPSDAAEQSISFFSPKDGKDFSKSSGSEILESPATLWNDLQYDMIWENAVDYMYSICNAGESQQDKVVQLYTKVKKWDSLRSCFFDQMPPHVSEALQSYVKTMMDKLESFADAVQRSLKNGVRKASTSDGEKVNKKCGKHRSGVDELACGSEQVHKPDHEISCSLTQLEICADLMEIVEKTAKKSLFLEHLAPVPGRTTHQGFENLSLLFNVHDKENLVIQNGLESKPTTEQDSESNDFDGNERKNAKKPNNSQKSPGSKKEMCPIEMDEYLSDKLRTTPGPNWTCGHDIQLVQLLVKSLGGATSKLNSKCLPKHMSVLPSLFSPTVLVRYPMIASYSAEALTFRALALFRVVHVLDCVLPLLCSTSPAADLVTRPLTERAYPMASFTDSSFDSTKFPVVLRADPQRENEAEIYLLSGIKSIHKRQDSLRKNLALRQSIHRHLKAEQFLIKKQMRLLEIQKLALEQVESRALMKIMSSCELDQLDIARQRVMEQKPKKQELTRQQSDILAEAKLNEVKIRELKCELDVLNKEEKNIKEVIKKLEKLRKNSRQAHCSESRDRSVPFFTWTPEKTNSKYNAGSLLSTLRFVLPLSNRRAGILAELLRTTEQPLPDQAPVVYVDRRSSVSERLSSPATSVFYQIFESLKTENMNFRWNKRKCDQWWEVKFVGEGIIDQGGGFRDSLSEMSDELCPQDIKINKTLPLLVKSVNHRDQVGDHRDCFIPNRSCNDLKAFHWLGKLMGAAYRSDESLALYFPPYFWKLLVGEHVTWSGDFAGVDALAVNMINNIETATTESFERTYACDLDFSTAYSDGTIVTVKENGDKLLVDYTSRLEYCQQVKKIRMMEFIEQVKAIRDGVLSVIPQCLLELITSQELERGVCGFDEISISLLKESIHYGDELSSQSECVIQLWKVLENFTAEDRCRFLRFVTGRKRLPACITLSQMCGEKDTLPGASTCASTLMLPSYSSLEVAEKKLRYAIYNCIAIDTDTSPW